MDTVVLAPAGYLLDPDIGSDYERPWRLAKGLAKRGLRVVLVAREVKRQDELGPDVEVSKPPGPLPATPLGRVIDRANLYWHARRVAHREVRAGSVLVVHHCGPCGDQSPSLVGHLPVPFVYGPVPAPRPSGLGDDEWLSWLRTPQASAAQAWLSRTAARQAGAVGTFLAGSTIRRADAITIEASMNAASRRADAIVIPPGVDVDHFCPGAQQTRVTGRVIAVGNLIVRKGYDILIRAVADVIQRNKSAHLLVVGNGPDEVSLQQLAQQLGIASAVTFVGTVARSELPTYLRSAEVFCHPARYDTFPLAPLEAMACGLPTLVSSAGALPEIVGDAGLVHATGDEAALSKDLNDVLGSPPLRSRLGTAGRDRVVEHFTWQNMSDAYLDLYRRLAVNKKVLVR